MQIEVTNQPNGVKAVIKGFSAQALQEKVDACQNGSCGCDCDPAMMQEIRDINVQATQDGAIMTITGKVDAAKLQPMMQSCLIDDKDASCAH